MTDTLTIPRATVEQWRDALGGAYLRKEWLAVVVLQNSMNEALARQEPVGFGRVVGTYAKAVEWPKLPEVEQEPSEAQSAAVQEPVAWRWNERGRWFDWTTDWTHYERAKSMGVFIEYAYTTPQPAKADHWQQYAKPGETAQQCIERHRAEQDALMTLLAQARSEPNAKAEGQEQRSEDKPVACCWETSNGNFHNFSPIHDKAASGAACHRMRQTFHLLYADPQRREVWCGCGDGIMPDSGAKCGNCIAAESPPRREWVEVKRSEINQMMADAGWQNSALRQADLDKVEKVVRAIEARLKEKNA